MMNHCWPMVMSRPGMVMAQQGMLTIGPQGTGAQVRGQRLRDGIHTQEVAPPGEGDGDVVLVAAGHAVGAVVFLLEGDARRSGGVDAGDAIAGIEAAEVEDRGGGDLAGGAGGFGEVDDVGLTECRYRLLPPLPVDEAPRRLGDLYPRRDGAKANDQAAGSSAGSRANRSHGAWFNRCEWPGAPGHCRAPPLWIAASPIYTEGICSACRS